MCPRTLSGGLASSSGRLPESHLQQRGRKAAHQATQCYASRRHSQEHPAQRRTHQAQAASFAAWERGSGSGNEADEQSAAPSRGKSWQAQNDGRINRPLKINLDLKLFKARQKRKDAYRQHNSKKRLQLMQAAENLFRECMEVDPSDGRAYVSLGRILVEGNRRTEARQLYEEGTRLTEGTNAYIWAAWAFLEAKMGNFREARKLYDASTVADSGHAAAYHGWGLMEKRQGNIIAARDLWLKGISKTKKQKTANPYLYQSLAVLAAEMGLTESARNWFNRGTSTIPGQASHAMWVSWAMMEAQQGDARAARYLFKRAQDVGPRSRYLHLAWAMYELDRGKRDFARKLLERGHLLNPKDAAILQALALLEEEQGNYVEARTYFEKGSQTDPTHLHIWQAWGVMEFRRGRHAKARELFQQGVWADANSRDVAYIWQAWGVLETKARNYQLARKLFRCAVKALPQSEPSWQAWAQMEWDLGNYPRANELRQYSLEEQQEVVLPRNFADPESALAPGVLDPILDTIARWGKSFEESRARTGRRSAPAWLDPDGNPLPQREPPPGARQPSRGTTAAFGSGAGPWSGSGSDNDGMAGEGNSAGVWDVLGARERDEMRSMIDGTDLRLPDIQQRGRRD